MVRTMIDEELTGVVIWAGTQNPNAPSHWGPGCFATGAHIMPLFYVIKFVACQKKNYFFLFIRNVRNEISGVKKKIRLWSEPFNRKMLFSRTEIFDCMVNV